jgi:spore coat polysaccharide biosynthesis protein SpsF
MSYGPTVAIVQARMTSTRLPGKVLRPIMGRPMLSYQLERVGRARKLDQIVVATTTNAEDDPIVAFCTASGVAVARGSEADVLSRYSAAAQAFDAGIVVRLTSDCPLIDPDLIDLAVGQFKQAKGTCDYLSNMLEPTYPYGMAVEVMSASALRAAAAEADSPAEREHVTPFMYWRPERFRLQSLTMKPDLSHHRWTVDTPEDFELVSRVLEALYPARPEFHQQDVLDLLGRHPDWVKINSHVEQIVVAPGKQEHR